MSTAQLVCLVFIGTGCSVVSGGAGVLKSPVQQQCESAGLKGCPALAEGVVQYVDGDKQKSTERLKAGVAANNPEKVVNFAKGLKTVTGLPLPGVGQYTTPVNEVATLIVRLSAEVERVTPPDKSDSGAATAGPAQTKVTTTTTALVSDAAMADPSSDPDRMVTKSDSAWASQLRCEIFGNEAACLRVRLGPFILTDVSALTGCDDAIYIGAELKENPYKKEGLLKFKWLVPATHPGIHGARYILNRGETLMIAVQKGGEQLVENPRCVVTWSGYRPDQAPATDAGF